MKSLRDIQLDPKVVKEVMDVIAAHAADPNWGYARTYATDPPHYYSPDLPSHEPLILRGDYTCHCCGQTYCQRWHP